MIQQHPISPTPCNPGFHPPSTSETIPNPIPFRHTYHSIPNHPHTFLQRCIGTVSIRNPGDMELVQERSDTPHRTDDMGGNTGNTSLRQKKRQPVVEADCQGGVKCGTEKVGGAKHRGKKEDEKTWTPAIPWSRWLNCNHQRAGMSTTGTGYPPMGGGGAKKEGTIPRDRPQKRWRYLMKKPLF